MLLKMPGNPKLKGGLVVRCCLMWKQRSQKSGIASSPSTLPVIRNGSWYCIFPPWECVIAGLASSGAKIPTLKTLQITNRGPEELDVVAEMTKAQIAVITEKPPSVAGSMIMIATQATIESTPAMRARMLGFTNTADVRFFRPVITLCPSQGGT